MGMLCQRGTLSAGLLGLALVAGCGPALSIGQAPSAPRPSEFVPGHRPGVGITLRYYAKMVTSGTSRGDHDPEDTLEMGMTYHVLSVDQEGTSSVRADLDGAPYMVARVRRDGTVLDARSLTPGAIAPGVEGLVGIVFQAERPVRVGDAIPFRHPEKGAMGEFVGTMVLRRFSPVGRCWAAEIQGAGRIDPSGWPPNYDNKTRRHFRTKAIVVDMSGRTETRTGAMVEARTVMTFEMESLVPAPPVRTKWAITTDIRLDPSSLGALGCS